jgi:DNA-binding SARP family transcriptional activator
MFRLQTFGGLALTSGPEARQQPRRRLAVLARLVAAGPPGVSRDELLALFWPDRDLESARHSLDQLLYEARRSLGASPTVGTSQLRLNPVLFECDVLEWASSSEASSKRPSRSTAARSFKDFT